MNAKEKANELMSKFVGISLSQVNELVDGIRIRLAKESALIAVEEIINSRPAITDSQLEYNNFWNDVKSELQSF
jgi:hypothetical protein